MGFLLKLKIKEAYTIKVMAELLQNSLKEGCFVITPDKIVLSGIDSRSTLGNEMIKLTLYKDRFIYYKCATDSMVIGITFLHFYKMLKSIKKKDTLILFIEEDKPLDLGIKIQQPGDNSSSISYVKITKINPVDIDEFDGKYDDPIITTSKEFQKLKTLNKISKELKITSNGKLIKFFCNKENVLSRDIIIGEEDDEDNTIHNEDITFSHTFETSQIVKLVKMACLSSTIRLYIKEDLPLKIGLSVGNLGHMNIFIKYKEKLDEEQYDQKES